MLILPRSFAEGGLYMFQNTQKIDIFGNKVLTTITYVEKPKF